MAKRKVYAVKKGKEIGIFQTWEACKASVDGYPGAEYKSFLIMEEAMKYLGEQVVISKNPHNQEGIMREHLIAYVDGSFDLSMGKYSFGCVFLTPEGNTIEEFGNGDNPDLLAIRNVAGEMLGAMYAVRWAMMNHYPSIEIRYDYEGIEKWATGAWRAKMDLTQKYAAYMQEHEKDIQISYKKIAAHTGDYYNEEADKLAKRGLTQGHGIPEVRLIR